MINKQNLWFITLFSLILVLSVFYITMPGEELLRPVTSPVPARPEATPTANVEESEALTALRVARDEKRTKAIGELQAKVNDTKTNTRERNRALEQIKTLNTNAGREKTLEEKIKKEHEHNVFIEVDGNTIKVVTDCEDCTKEKANKIMRSIQSEFKTRKIISVRFLG